MHASTVAIDLAKEVFGLAFADAQGRVIERKRLSRKAFARSLELRPPLRVLMEACGGAHYWARRFQRQGHAVRLIPARDVRPYVRGNKTDRNDVAGMLEADRCAGIAEVPVKTPEQQGIQALHRLREHLKGERTATLNLLRGVLREFGVAMPLGAAKAARLKQRRGQDLDPLQSWALALQTRQGHNKAACALASKLARRLWAMEHHGKAFDPRHVSQRPIAR